MSGKRFQFCWAASLRLIKKRRGCEHLHAIAIRASFEKAILAAKLYEVSPANCGAIAQLGERTVRNGEVVGSIPTSSTSVSDICGSSSNAGLSFVTQFVT